MGVGIDRDEVLANAVAVLRVVSADQSTQTTLAVATAAKPITMESWSVPSRSRLYFIVGALLALVTAAR